jgi:hypothetical protein
MSRYRIVCVESKYFESGKHDHLTVVGTGKDPAAADKKWTVAEVRSAIDGGDEFFTRSVSTGNEAKVEKFTCSTCDFKTIRSNADRVQDNNLDNLRTCSWKS